MILSVAVSWSESDNITYKALIMTNLTSATVIGFKTNLSSHKDFTHTFLPHLTLGEETFVYSCTGI